MARILSYFRPPYWLCRNARKFVNNEDDLPVDQPMLLACIAPRCVHVHSSVVDTGRIPVSLEAVNGPCPCFAIWQLGLAGT